MPSPSVLIVGSYAVGLVMQTERLPGPGETLLGHDYRSTHGGKGSNQAVQAARLGASVAFLGCIGVDAHGDACAQLFTAEGIATSGLIRHATLPTGVGFIVVDGHGRNLITLDMGANAALTPAAVEARPAFFSGPRVVLSQLEIPLATAPRRAATRPRRRRHHAAQPRTRRRPLRLRPLLKSTSSSPTNTRPAFVPASPSKPRSTTPSPAFFPSVAVMSS
jgi:sugar/nucleoside kinase (ribokinase family)